MLRDLGAEQSIRVIAALEQQSTAVVRQTIGRLQRKFDTSSFFVLGMKVALLGVLVEDQFYRQLLAGLPQQTSAQREAENWPRICW